MKTLQQLRGKKAEDIALQYLKKAGLKIIKANYLCKLGEIDLIMQDKDYIVFVEVRYRKNTHFGTGADTIQTHKRKRIIRAAQAFLKFRRWSNTKPCRFDVIDMSGELSAPNIRWIRSAFTT